MTEADEFHHRIEGCLPGPLSKPTRGQMLVRIQKPMSSPARSPTTSRTVCA